MMPNGTVDPSEGHDVKTEVGAIALVVAVIVVGYALAPRTDPAPPWSSGISASARAERTSRPTVQAVPPSGASAAQGTREVAPVGRGDEGLPRECAPDRGIADACVY